MKKQWIIVHHSATPDGQTFSWGAIRRFHIQDRGWRDIGYHLGTELVGDSYENVLGRDWDDHGAHCPDGMMNAIGLGWCIVGNFDILRPDPKLWGHVIKTAKYLTRFLKIAPENVMGHMEAQSRWGHVTKTCPGKMFDMDRLRKEIACPPLGK